MLIVFVYFEILLLIFQSGNALDINPIRIFTAILFGAMLDLVFLFFARKKYILSSIASFVFAIIYAVESYIYNFFLSYQPLDTISHMSGQVAGTFSSDAFSIVIGRPYILILYLFPFLIYLIICIVEVATKGNVGVDTRSSRIIYVVIIIVLSILNIYQCNKEKKFLVDNYEFNNVVKKYGLLTGIKYDLKYKINKNVGVDASSTRGLIDDQPLQAKDQPLQMNTDEKNELDIDFNSLSREHSKESRFVKLNNYISSQTPTSKNKYTGLFKGKNLVLICAESLSKYAITEKLTPTLYRMMHNGFYFSDAYDASTATSTTEGEFEFLFGLNPPNGVLSLSETIGHNNYFTMASQMKRLGYHTAAYHNGNYTYYNRNVTHVNLGYDTFLAMGNGLDTLTKYDNSDYEMFDKTLPLYIDKKPFSVFYMTIDGHLPYNKKEKQYKKYADFVKENIKDSDKEELVEYLCKMVSFDRALENYVNKLKECNELSNTVFAITSDHYPYALDMSSEKNYVHTLYGYKFEGSEVNKRDSNAIIIWCEELENELKDFACEISTPTYAEDITPTLSNLFGMAFDSRFYSGRDVFSEAMPLVIWNNYSFLTEKGFYNANKNKFTLKDTGEEISLQNMKGTDDISIKEYVEKMLDIVKDKINLSIDIVETDYFKYLFGENKYNSNNRLVKSTSDEATYNSYDEFSKDFSKKSASVDTTYLKSLMVHKNGDDIKTIKFGKIEQDGNIENGKEDIIWNIVMKDDGFILQSKYILDARSYHNEERYSPWRDSDLRKYLNNEFYNEAFNEIEKNLIKDYNTGNAVSDKVFVLSASELENICPGEMEKDDSFLLSTYGTIAAFRKGLYVRNEEGKWFDGNSPYWLRDTLMDQNFFMSAIEYNGNVNKRGYVCTLPYCGVRPAIFIKEG